MKWHSFYLTNNKIKHELNLLAYCAWQISTPVFFLCNHPLVCVFVTENHWNWSCWRWHLLHIFVLLSQPWWAFCTPAWIATWENHTNLRGSGPASWDVSQCLSASTTPVLYPFTIPTLRSVQLPSVPWQEGKRTVSPVLATTFHRLILSNKYLIMIWRGSSFRLCLNSLVTQKLNFDNNVQLSLTLAALSLGLWWTFDRSRSGFGLGITTAFVATVFTQLLVYNGVYQWVLVLIVSPCWSWKFVSE